MATKTINLTGAEVAVTGLDGAHAHIRNDGTEVIYAAKTAGITAGADGVASIPAGQSDTIRGISGAVYLLGTGSVLIHSDDYVVSPFKTSAQGSGSGADEVARAAINTHSGNAEIHVTAEDKAAWNAVNYSNPNLLINPDFKINQRGMTTYTSKGYVFDRWYLDTSDGAGSLSIGDSGLTYTVSNPTVWNELRQVIIPDVAKSLGGKTVTMSAMIDGTLYYGTASNLDIAANYVPISITIGDVRFDLRNYPTSNKPINLYVRIGGSKDFVLPNIEYVKVELGGIATPFVPPDPATELAKCQRYYQLRSTGDIAAVDLRPTMRDTPTITQLSDGNYAYSAEL